MAMSLLPAKNPYCKLPMVRFTQCTRLSHGDLGVYCQWQNPVICTGVCVHVYFSTNVRIRRERESGLPMYNLYGILRHIWDLDKDEGKDRPSSMVICMTIQSTPRFLGDHVCYL